MDAGQRAALAAVGDWAQQKEDWLRGTADECRKAEADLDKKQQSFVWQGSKEVVCKLQTKFAKVLNHLEWAEELMQQIGNEARRSMREDLATRVPSKKGG